MTTRQRPPRPDTPDDVEHRFYDALRRGDLDQLLALWADDQDVTCVHPGGPRVVGLTAIRMAFAAIFANGSIDVEVEHVRRVRSDGCAVHSVLEHIRLMGTEGPQSAWVVATNVYLLTPEGWRLAAHHASPGSSSELMDFTEERSILH